jgi:hypothetical protein
MIPIKESASACIMSPWSMSQRPVADMLPCPSPYSSSSSVDLYDLDETPKAVLTW